MANELQVSVSYILELESGKKMHLILKKKNIIILLKKLENVYP